MPFEVPDIVLCQGLGVVQVLPRLTFTFLGLTFLFVTVHNLLVLLAGADGDGGVGLRLLKVAGQLLVEAVVGSGPLTGGAPVLPLVHLLLVARAPPLGLLVPAVAGQAGQRHAPSWSHLQTHGSSYNYKL